MLGDYKFPKPSVVDNNGIGEFDDFYGGDLPTMGFD
jgi:hypothetical protein